MCKVMNDSQQTVFTREEECVEPDRLEVLLASGRVINRSKLTVQIQERFRYDKDNGTG